MARKKKQCSAVNDIPTTLPAADAAGGCPWQPLAALVLLLLATAWAYSPVLDADYINFDDNDYVYENAMVQKGLTAEGLRWAFTSAHAANYHPLTWVSHMLDAQLFGYRPGSQHAVNLLLHLANTLLLFLLVFSLTPPGATPEDGGCGRSAWGALLVAGLFALHPLHVESVAWISERKDVLSTFFFLLTLLAWGWYAARPSLLRYGMTALALALGLLAKPMLVTAPFVLLLLDYWPLRRKAGLGAAQRFGLLFVEKAPLLALAGGSIALTLWAQGSYGAMASLDELPLLARLANAPVACVMYLWKTLCPTGLGIFHPFRFASMWQPIAATVLLLAITGVLVWQRRMAPWALMGWLWFLGTLAPVIGIVQVGGQAWAERYTYIPHMGLFWGAVWALMALWRRQVQGRALPALARQVLAAGMCCALAAPLAWATYVQAGHWQDSESLYLQTLEQGGPNDLIHYNLGVHYSSKGRRSESIAQYRKALEDNPQNHKAMNNLAWLLAASPEDELRDGKEAVRLASKALGIAGANPAIMDTLAAALAEAGRHRQAHALAQKAAAAARQAGMEAMAGEIEKKIPFYAQGSAFRIGAER